MALYKQSSSYTVTESDCYVTLSLPTASSDNVRTATVHNTKNPVWNQSFCYRIDSRIKNVLQLKICDEDTFTRDDELYTVLFDVAKLHPGKTSRVVFKLNPKARELSCVEIKVNTKKLKRLYTSDLIFAIKGSYEGMQKIPLTPDSHNRNLIRFHCIKNNQSNLEVSLPKKWEWSKLKENAESLTSVTLPLTEVAAQGKISIEELQKICYGQNVKDAKVQYFRAKDLDVRLANELSVAEKNFLRKRRKYVAAAVKKTLQLPEDLQDDEVPVVAIMTTGGGTRSFTAMYGSLLGLQKLNLLDSITYIAGLSGTTWTMAKLYEDAYWSQKYLEEAINEARKQVSKCKIKCFSMDCLKYYYNELKQRRQEGHDSSFIDLWGLVIESMLYDEKTDHTLSHQQVAVNEGQNPLPIYLAISLKDNYSAQDFKEWLEFNPYEVGNLKYGAHIHTEHFGSMFFMGRLMKKLPEVRMCFMLGMWSSIFSLDFMYFWHLSSSAEDFWCKWTQDRVEDIDDTILPSRPHELDTRVVCAQGQLSRFLREVLTGRPTIAEYPNFLRGFQMHDEYLNNKHFSTWKGTNLDQFSRYASKQGIPFPRMEISEEDRENLKECYVFDDAENTDVPTVLFFPLTNDTFKKYKAPGEERDPTEMKEGDIDVSSFLSPFTTREVTFSEENFDRLVKLTEYNILNNEDKIVKALHAAVKQRKQQKHKQQSC
uniref:cytosolic phospholipase A2 epsilon-like n=1 Tax=Euleptes europaea TaxID=460621 RepID=UPI0025412F37|nr:cytosolic phospholipase A2 epsilon-like [Euleptes europaea]